MSDQCHLCESEPSTIRCTRCQSDDVGDSFCAGCSAQLHSTAKGKLHVLTDMAGKPLGGGGGSAVPSPRPSPAPSSSPPPAAAAGVHTVARIPLCSLCDDDPATVWCSTCALPYCADCSSSFHKPAKQAGHTILRLQQQQQQQLPGEPPSPLDMGSLPTRTLSAFGSGSGGSGPPSMLASPLLRSLSVTSPPPQLPMHRRPSSIGVSNLPLRSPLLQPTSAGVMPSQPGTPLVGGGPRGSTLAALGLTGSTKLAQPRLSLAMFPRQSVTGSLNSPTPGGSFLAKGGLGFGSPNLLGMKPPGSPNLLSLSGGGGIGTSPGSGGGGGGTGASMFGGSQPRASVIGTTLPFIEAATPAPGGEKQCGICESEPATRSCAQCEDAFCRECDIDMHTSASKISHVRTDYVKPANAAASTPAATASSTAAAAAAIAAAASPAAAAPAAAVASSAPAAPAATTATAGPAGQQTSRSLLSSPSNAAQSAANSGSSSISPSPIDGGGTSGSASASPSASKNGSRRASINAKRPTAIQTPTSASQAMAALTKAAQQQAGDKKQTGAAAASPSATVSAGSSAAASPHVAASASTSSASSAAANADPSAAAAERGVPAPAAAVTSPVAAASAPLPNSSGPTVNVELSAPSSPIIPANVAPGGLSLLSPSNVPLCTVCDKPAAVHCAECDLDLCVKGGCDASIHRPAKMVSHKREPIILSTGAAIMTNVRIIPPTPVQQAVNQKRMAGDTDKEEEAGIKPVSLAFHEQPRTELAAAAAPVLPSPKRSVAPLVMPSPAVSTTDVPAVQPLCSMCDDLVAEVHCDECDMDLCIKGGCDTDLHKPAKQQGHKRTKIGGGVETELAAPAPAVVAASATTKSSPNVSVVKPVPASEPSAPTPVAAAAAMSSSTAAPVLCGLCDDKPAAVRCNECDMDLCISGGCDKDLHQSAKASSHVRTPLQNLPAAASPSPVTGTVPTAAAAAPAPVSSTPSVPAAIATPVATAASVVVETKPSVARKESSVAVNSGASTTVSSPAPSPKPAELKPTIKPVESPKAALTPSVPKTTSCNTSQAALPLLAKDTGSLSSQKSSDASVVSSDDDSDDDHAALDLDMGDLDLDAEDPFQIESISPLELSRRASLKVATEQKNLLVHEALAKGMDAIKVGQGELLALSSSSTTGQPTTTTASNAAFGATTASSNASKVSVVLSSSPKSSSNATTVAASSPQNASNVTATGAAQSSPRAITVKGDMRTSTEPIVQPPSPELRAFRAAQQFVEQERLQQVEAEKEREREKELQRERDQERERERERDRERDLRDRPRPLSVRRDDSLDQSTVTEDAETERDTDMQREEEELRTRKRFVHRDSSREPPLRSPRGAHKMASPRSRPSPRHSPRRSSPPPYPQAKLSSPRESSGSSRHASPRPIDVRHNAWTRERESERDSREHSSRSSDERHYSNRNNRHHGGASRAVDGHTTGTGTETERSRDTSRERAVSAQHSGRRMPSARAPSSGPAPRRPSFRDNEVDERHGTGTDTDRSSSFHDDRDVEPSFAPATRFDADLQRHKADAEHNARDRYEQPAAYDDGDDMGASEQTYAAHDEEQEEFESQDRREVFYPQPAAPMRGSNLRASGELTERELAFAAAQGSPRGAVRAHSRLGSAAAGRPSTFTDRSPHAAADALTSTASALVGSNKQAAVLMHHLLNTLHRNERGEVHASPATALLQIAQMATAAAMEHQEQLQQQDEDAQSTSPHREQYGPQAPMAYPARGGRASAPAMSSRQMPRPARLASVDSEQGSYPPAHEEQFDGVQPSVLSRHVSLTQQRPQSAASVSGSGSGSAGRRGRASRLAEREEALLLQQQQQQQLMQAELDAQHEEYLARKLHDRVRSTQQHVLQGMRQTSMRTPPPPPPPPPLSPQPPAYHPHHRSGSGFSLRPSSSPAMHSFVPAANVVSPHAYLQHPAFYTAAPSPAALSTPSPSAELFYAAGSPLRGTSVPPSAAFIGSSHPAHPHAHAFSPQRQQSPLPPHGPLLSHAFSSPQQLTPSPPTVPMHAFFSPTPPPPQSHQQQTQVSSPPTAYMVPLQPRAPITPLSPPPPSMPLAVAISPQQHALAVAAATAAYHAARQYRSPTPSQQQQQQQQQQASPLLWQSPHTPLGPPQFAMPPLSPFSFSPSAAAAAVPASSVTQPALASPSTHADASAPGATPVTPQQHPPQPPHAFLSQLLSAQSSPATPAPPAAAMPR